MKTISDRIFEKLKEKGMSQKEFSQKTGIAESSISDGGKLSGFSEKVDDIGGGVYHIVYKIGIFVALVGIVWAGIKLITSNAGTREEAKSSIIYKVFGVILIAAAASIVIFLATAGKDLLD